MAANTLAWGFIGLQHLFDQRLADTNVRVIDDAVEQSLAEWNRSLAAITDALVRPVNAAKERFRLPGSGTLQPLDEHGIPMPVRAGAYQEIGFPIVGGGTAWGTNRVSRALMTVGEANDMQVLVQTQDADWMRRHILGAFISNADYDFTDYEIGVVTVFPLANGDDQLFYVDGALDTDDHYTAQAADIGDLANPFPEIEALLRHHPGNDGPFVAFIADDLKADVQALANFTPVADPDIIAGGNTDRLVATPGGIRGFGDEVIGKVDGVWIVTWRVMPSGYILTLATGASEPALAQRQYPDASLQGLFEEDHSPDGNRFERRFIRYTGFAARNRAAAVMTQIGNAAYQIPTGWATPLPV